MKTDSYMQFLCYGRLVCLICITQRNECIFLIPVENVQCQIPSFITLTKFRRNGKYEFSSSTRLKPVLYTTMVTTTVIRNKEKQPIIIINPNQY